MSSFNKYTLISSLINTSEYDVNSISVNLINYKVMSTSNIVAKDTKIRNHYLQTNTTESIQNKIIELQQLLNNILYKESIQTLTYDEQLIKQNTEQQIYDNQTLLSNIETVENLLSQMISENSFMQERLEIYKHIYPSFLSSQILLSNKAQQYIELLFNNSAPTQQQLDEYEIESNQVSQKYEEVILLYNQIFENISNIKQLRTRMDELCQTIN